MDNKTMNQIFLDTAYVRTGGSPEELQCAQYLKEQCEAMGFSAHLEAFDVDMAAMKIIYVIVWKLTINLFEFSLWTKIIVIYNRNFIRKALHW